MALGSVKLNRNEVVLLSLFALACFYLFNTYWMKPKNKALEKVRNEVSIAESEVEKNQLLLTALKSRAPASNDAKTSIDIFEKYIKGNDRFSNVIAGVVSNSSHSGFNVSKISAESQAQVDGYSQILYKVEADASFISIGKFLENLEDSPLLTEVQSIEIGRTGADLRMLKATLKIFSYVSKTSDLEIKRNTEGDRTPAGVEAMKKIEKMIDHNNEVAKKLEPIQKKLMGEEEAVKQ